MNTKSISREVNNEEIAWMAGIWDGEGCISASFRKNRINFNPVLCIETFVKNTDVLMIQKISRILYAARIKFCFFLQKAHKDRNNVDHKKIICIKVAGKGNVHKLLELMLPYLVTKKQQALLTLQLITYRNSIGHHGPAKCNGSTQGKKNWNGKVITDDTVIVDLVNRITKSKSNLIDPSETLRIASKPLIVKSKEMKRYEGLLDDIVRTHRRL